MIFVYILLGFVLVALTIFLLDYREKMTKNIKLIKEYKNEVDHLNQQLDDVNETLQSLSEPLSKISNVSQKILKKMSK
ncbi:MAG: hypothetical protein LUF02_08445 [Erysipelotrichaceae bacterium]|nr:hypothetical protein [Erysipelotrichaceae bacterium]